MRCDVRWMYVPLLLPIRNANEKPKTRKKHYEHLMLKSEVFCSIRGVCIFLSFLSFFDHPRRVNRLRVQSYETAMKPTVAVASLSHVEKNTDTLEHIIQSTGSYVYPKSLVPLLLLLLLSPSFGWLAAIHRFPSNAFFLSSYTILINKILFLI